MPPGENVRVGEFDALNITLKRLDDQSVPLDERRYRFIDRGGTDVSRTVTGNAKKSEIANQLDLARSRSDALSILDPGYSTRASINSLQSAVQGSKVAPIAILAGLAFLVFTLLGFFTSD